MSNCAEWNATEADYPSDVCLNELIEQQVERTPQSVAVVFEKKELTYKQLNQRANQLAHYLRNLGVGPEVRVGICMERSLEMVVAILAVLKSGAAYVPLDPEYPKERLAFMLSDSQATILITTLQTKPRLPSTHANTICVDIECAIDQPVTNLSTLSSPDNAAYVIYTSGSTGRPKGVVITHRGICNHMLWMTEEWVLTNVDAILQKTVFAFDASMWEFFAPLMAGARLIIAEPEVHSDPTLLLRLVVHRISVLQLVPSLLSVF